MFSLRGHQERNGVGSLTNQTTTARLVSHLRASLYDGSHGVRTEMVPGDLCLTRTVSCRAGADFDAYESVVSSYKGTMAILRSEIP